MAAQKEGVTRREFLKRTTAGVVVGSALPTILPKRVFGANDRVNIAVIGIRGQGGSHIRGFGKIPDVHIKTICDVDENLFPERLKDIEERFGYQPGTEHDMRRVFDDPDIDAVTFATPNHWHALGTIWACQAKKNVYVEKPSSHNIWEGRQMVHAARANNVLVQVGFQNRSRRNTMAAIKFLHDGHLGEVYMARGLCFKPRGDIGRYPDGPLKKGETFSLLADGSKEMPAYTEGYLEKVHYDLWMGPTHQRPFNRNRFHYNWHWNWEYGNGDTGNQGPHQLDIGRWGWVRRNIPSRYVPKAGILSTIRPRTPPTPRSRSSSTPMGRSSNSARAACGPTRRAPSKSAISFTVAKGGSRSMPAATGRRS